MKAWQYSKDLIDNAKPVILDKPPENWDLFSRMEKMEDERVRFWWHSKNLGAGMPECFIVAMIQSIENKGYYAEPAERWIEKGLEAYEANDMEALFRATYRIKHLTTLVDKNPQAPYWQYTQYNSFEQLLDEVEFPEPVEVDEQSEDFARRIYAGWLGKIIGSQLGSALEGYTTNQIIEICGKVRTYVRKPTTLTNDITHELAFLRCFETKGYSVNAIDIADEWVASIPYGTDAEDLALRSIKLGYYPPESGNRNNPFSDWVGAQMRGMICGMVAPGDPKEAARLAWMDGTVSHGNNGILGEVFNAVLTAQAFVEPDIRKLLEDAVNMIPARSEYHHMVSTFLNWCKEDNDWLTVWRKCEEMLDKYHWVHAYPNAAAEVVALWFGNGDFDETMHILAMAGRKADCNASEIGAVLGIAKGAEHISAEWKTPISDDVRTYVRGMRRLTITGLAERTVEAVKRGVRY
jgi:ADP-ribosylglycohydrolase